MALRWVPCLFLSLFWEMMTHLILSHSVTCQPPCAPSLWQLTAHEAKDHGCSCQKQRAVGGGGTEYPVFIYTRGYASARLHVVSPKRRICAKGASNTMSGCQRTRPVSQTLIRAVSAAMKPFPPEILRVFHAGGWGAHLCLSECKFQISHYNKKSNNFGRVLSVGACCICFIIEADRMCMWIDFYNNRIIKCIFPTCFRRCLQPSVYRWPNLYFLHYHTANTFLYLLSQNNNSGSVQF